ncbi:MAG: DUF1461 domain-containing protein [Pseudomonadales bacterium]|nr:DUF1461 domain-containing protein [Pseudomonadales bacterium]
MTRRPGTLSIASSPLPALGRFLLTLSSLLSVCWLSWHLLAAVDFGYGAGYRLLHIEQHIQRYGPANRFRPGFGQTNPDQHHRLFGDIVTAIQSGGAGLQQIYYRTGDGRRHPLLRPPEVQHLQDVARLITAFNWAGLAGSLALLVLADIYYRRGLTPPTPGRMATGLLISIALLAVLMALVGPTRVFYWLHTWVFPADHQWFFYYQESLMTTLMKAPDLFGFIAVLWGLLTLVLFALLQWALHRVLRHPGH